MTTIQPLSPSASIPTDPELPASIASTEPAPVLAAPTAAVSTADIGLAIATLSIDSAFDRRKSARTVHDQAERSLAQSEARQLAGMQEEADEKLTSAETNAWGEMLSGALSVGAAGKALATPGTAGSWLELGRGASSLATGGFKLATADDDRDAAQAEVSAKASEQASGHLKDLLADAKDDVGASRDSVQKALDFLKEYESAQAQTAAAALHRA